MLLITIVVEVTFPLEIPIFSILKISRKKETFQGWIIFFKFH